MVTLKKPLPKGPRGLNQEIPGDARSPRAVEAMAKRRGKPSTRKEAVPGLRRYAKGTGKKK